MTDHTRRIVESPLFELMPGLFGDVYNEETGLSEVHHVRYVSGQDGNVSFGVLNAVDCDELYGDDSNTWRDYFSIILDGPYAESVRPTNTALLIYMLSKHCAWAKLHGETVHIGHNVGVGHRQGYVYDVEIISAPTLAETFAQAFAFVEGLR